ncbi:legumin A-like protein [Tanacetum coccineum]
MTWGRGQQGESQQKDSNNLFQGFDGEFFAEAFSVDQETGQMPNMQNDHGTRKILPSAYTTFDVDALLTNPKHAHQLSNDRVFQYSASFETFDLQRSRRSDVSVTSGLPARHDL